MEEESHCQLHISFSNLAASIIAISLNIKGPLMHSFYLQYILTKILMKLEVQITFQKTRIEL